MSTTSGSMPVQLQARRRFLKLLAASPAVVAPDMGGLLAAGDETGDFSDLDEFLIRSPQEALDVFDFRALAKRALPPAHYGYLATGTDGNETLRANRDAFGRVYLRPMRMVDTARIDTHTELLGLSLRSPLLLAPVGSQNAFHAEGELATARAARTTDTLQILSNVATRSIEDVIAARGAPVWAQLYPSSNWSVAEKMLKRAQRAGAPAVVLTVDLNADSNRVMLGQYIRKDERDCSACHGSEPDDYFLRRPMYDGTGVTVAEMGTPGMTWDYVGRLKETTSMQVVVKGIVTAEDGDACVRAGADAVYVSNHGGRAEASGRAALDSLPEVVAAVAGRLPVIADSGFRRGGDIFKALALGADAVGIGRAYIWGLAAFGEAGVQKVLEMLNAELAMVMAQVGAPSLGEIGPQHVGAQARPIGPTSG